MNRDNKGKFIKGHEPLLDNGGKKHWTGKVINLLVIKVSIVGQKGD